jgi:tripartite-type tricarboxylate transporter receptor subunit TctC
MLPGRAHPLAMKRRFLAQRIAAVVLLTLAACNAGAAAGADTKSYPSRPVRAIVPFPAGSGTDLLARFIGSRLTERVGQQIVIDNRPGANGIIAAEATARAAPDGYTLMFMSVSHTMNAAVYPKLPFDPVKSFTPVMMLASGPLALVANPAFPADSVKSLLELARTKPRSITYAVSGTGGINHFAGALFARTAGVELVNVPYKGAPQALTDVISGQVQIMIGTLAVSGAHIRAGRLKALGVSTAKRTPLMPEVPTIAEGGVPGYEISIWWGMLAPAGLLGAAVTRLDTEIAAILAQPEAAKRLEADAAAPALVAGAAFSRVLTSEVERWRRVAREAEIKAE